MGPLPRTWHGCPDHTVRMLLCSQKRSMRSTGCTAGKGVPSSSWTWGASISCVGRHERVRRMCCRKMSIAHVRHGHSSCHFCS